jgi:hypothetical protein
MNEIVQKIIVTLGSALGVGVLTLFFESVRSALLWRRVQYDLSCTRKSGVKPFPCSWDITWEDFGLTFKAGDISNDHIDNIAVKLFTGGSESIAQLLPRDSFKPLFDKKLWVKISAIIRRDLPGADSEYTLRLVFRRRRKLFG